MAEKVSRYPARGKQRTLLEDQRRQILGGLMMLVGLALLFSPWVMGDSPTSGMEAHRDELGVGLVVVFAAAARLGGRAGKWSDLVIFLAGVWLLFAPWVLDAGDNRVTEGSRVLDHTAGALLILLALASRLMAVLVARRERHAEPEPKPESEPSPAGVKGSGLRP
jgi:hypothetical protein